MKMQALYLIYGIIFFPLSQNINGQEDVNDYASKESEGKIEYAYGIKAGLGLWRMASFQSTYSYTNTPPVYSYPLSFSVGAFAETPLSESFSIVGELSFQNIKLKVTSYTSIEGILAEEQNIKLIALSALIKYKASWLWDIYFISGPGIGYLLQAEYSFYDEIYHDNGKINNKEKMPAFTTSFDIGLGKIFELYEITFIAELRAQLGFTQFEYKEPESDYVNMGKWRNSGLILLIGIKL